MVFVKDLVKNLAFEDKMTISFHKYSNFAAVLF